MKNLILSLMAVLCIGAVNADNHPAPGKFGVTAEYLYFMPSFDDTYFVLNNTSGTTDEAVGKRLNNDFNFKSGYRIGAVYAFCACQRAFEVTYSHLNASQNRIVAGTTISGTLGRADFISLFENYSGTAASNLAAKYNRVDALFSQSVFDCCQTNVHLLFGLEYAYLRLNENYTYTRATQVGTNQQTSKVCGIGPELGVEIDYAILDCQKFCPGTLSLIVKSTGSLLSSESKTTVNTLRTPAQGAPVIEANLNDEKSWRVIPVFHARFGLGYETCICGTGASFEVGYEYSSYFRGFGRTNLVDDIAGNLAITNYNNYDLQGLYVSASVSF